MNRWSEKIESRLSNIPQVFWKKKKKVCVGAMNHKDVTAWSPMPPEMWLALELLLLQYYSKASIFQLRCLNIDKSLKKCTQYHRIVYTSFWKMLNYGRRPCSENIQFKRTVYVIGTRVCLGCRTFSADYTSFKIAAPLSPLIIFKEKASDGFMGSSSSSSVQGGW